MGQGVTVRVALGGRPYVGTQTRYKAPRDLLVKTVENAMINIGLLKLSPGEWPKVDSGTVK